MDVRKLLDIAQAYLPPDKLVIVEDAYHFAAEAHRGQVRLPVNPIWSTPCRPP